MTGTHDAHWSGDIAARLLDETVSLVIGAAFTLGLFLGMSHYGHGGPVAPPPVIEDLKAVTIPLDTPPPPPITPSEPQPMADTVTGIEVSAEADSPVQISVSVPVFDNLPVPLAPPARIEVAALYTEFKPKMDLTADQQHVFQLSEVDQRPAAIIRATPLIPPVVRKGATVLRIELMMVIDTKGKVSSMRITNKSGNDIFDEIVSKCVSEEWVFSPAIRKGKKVRCLVQQPFAVKWNSTPFEN